MPHFKKALDFVLRVILSFRSPFSTLRFSLNIKSFAKQNLFYGSDILHDFPISSFLSQVQVPFQANFQFFDFPEPNFLTHCGAKAISVHLFKFGTLYCICQPTWSVCLRKRRKFSRKSLGAIRKIPQGIPDISMMIDGQYRGNSKMYYSSVLVHMPDLHQYPSVYA